MSNTQSKFWGSLSEVMVLGLFLGTLGPGIYQAEAASPEVTFALSNHTSQPGQTVTAQLTVSNFTQVTSAQFTLQWDPAVLRFSAVGDYGLTGLASGNFGTTLTNSGKLTFSWDDPNAVGVSVADGTLIFSLTFVVIGAAGSVSPLTLVDTPTVREVAVNFEPAGFRSVAGEVQVRSQVNPVTFRLSNHTSQPGQTVTAQLTVSNFTQVTSAQFTLQWDPAVLRFSAVGDYGLAGLASGNFGTTLTNSGKLTFSWDDPNAVGVSVADGTVIFLVTFVIIGAAGSVSPLTLVDTPTVREVAVNFEPAGFHSVAGEVQVHSQVNPVTFALSSHRNLFGETAIARVTVGGFTQVTSAQFTLQWDPAVLRFSAVGDYGLAGLASGNFGSTLTNSGKLTFSWDDPNAVGVSVADGTVIFSVTFVVIGAAGSVSPLTLVDTPTVREVAVNFEPASFNSVTGEVQVFSSRFTRILLQFGTNCLLQATGTPGREYLLQCSTNIGSTNLTTWMDITRRVADANGLLEFKDTSAGKCQTQFYRLKATPQ